MSEPLLLAEEVVAGYVPEVDILRGCSLHVGSRELVGIIGPNGAGKSTLIKVIFGLVPLRSGSVRLAQEEIGGLAAHELVERGVGYVPQRDNVFATLSVDENLQMGVFLRPGELDERRDHVCTLFPLLSERLGQRAGSLSGGERQMLAMGRALMMQPSLLLLDEPSAGLSPAMQSDVFGRIAEINEAGVSILMVEQNARRCLEVADRGYVLDDGRNAYDGTGRDLLDDPRVVELYLGTLGTS